MNAAPPLLTLLDARPISQLGDVAENRLLGFQQIGAESASTLSLIPTQNISMPILYPAANALCDAWLANASCESERIGDVQFRCNSDVLFGVIEIDEKRFAQHAEDSALRAATYAAYRQIFNLLNEKNYPHLWRAWNYIPHILEDEAGLERYRQFNMGRHQAFETARRTVDTSPAASALGTHTGLLSVAFVAGRIAPTRIENPRQISAYAYPSQYGPRSPTFSRAVTISDDRHCMLFISGTASIIGHATVHSGDVSAQTREAIANISALLEQVNLSSTRSIQLEDLAYRIYIRHAQDCPLVRQTIVAVIKGNAHALYVQADICRPDLLVEIEAFVATRIAPESQ